MHVPCIFSSNTRRILDSWRHKADTPHHTRVLVLSERLLNPSPFHATKSKIVHSYNIVSSYEVWFNYRLPFHKDQLLLMNLLANLTRKYLSWPYTVTILIVKRDRLSLFSVAQYLIFLPNKPCKKAVYKENYTYQLYHTISVQNCLDLTCFKKISYNPACINLLFRHLWVLLHDTGKPFEMFVSFEDQFSCPELLQ